MSWGEYLGGLAFFAPMLGATALATWLLMSRRLRFLVGAPRVLAASMIFTIGIVVVHGVPGALGLLTREWVLVTALIGLGLVALVKPGGHVDPSPAPEPEIPSGTLSWVLVGAAASAVALLVLAFLREDATYPVIHGDVLTYHLPVVARWIQVDSLWPIAQFEPDFANANYPHSGHLLTLAFILPWENDAFARFPTVPYVPLTVLAVYALGREVRAPRATAILAGLALACCWIVIYPGVRLGFPDAVLLAAFGTGVLFLVRHWRSGRTSELVLAGAALGLAFGTKWYGVSCVGVILVVWAAVALVSKRGIPYVLRNGAILGSLTLALGGFWLLRNLVKSGSPFFPTGIKVFGVEVFDVPRDVIRERYDHTVSEYLLNFDVWRDTAGRQYIEAFGISGPIFVLGFLLLLGMLLAAWRGWTPRPPHFRLLLVGTGTALVLAAVYSKTPYTAFALHNDEPLLIAVNSRYLVPALMLALALMAWAIGRTGRARPLIELALVVGIGESLTRSFNPTLRGTVTTLLLFALAGGLWLILSRTPPERRHAVAIAAAAIAGLAAVAGAFRLQDTYQDHRYNNLDATFDWVDENAPPKARIGLARIDTLDGTSPVYSMYGKNLDNRVDYAGPFVDGTLRRYRNEADFRAAIKRRDYEFLLIGKSDRVEDVGVYPGRWARNAGYRPVARSKSVTLLRSPSARTR